MKLRSQTRSDRAGAGTPRAPTLNTAGEEVSVTQLDHCNDDVLPNPASNAGRRTSEEVNPERKLDLTSNRKRRLKIGTWNIRTLNKEGKIELLAEEVKRLGIPITGLCETHLLGNEQQDLDKDTILITSGKEKGKRETGVAIMLTGKVKDTLISANPVSDRILEARLDTKPVSTTIVQVYAPTNPSNQSNPQVTEDFYEQLQEVTDRVPKRDILIIMGDFNAKLGE